mmetsp:Transcript_29201/g.80222  ORF Transcript_29201/g.80222 Transcript_29201/m.80222 type:complete len:519 (-) Transcript_29201:217-1773(-)
MPELSDLSSKKALLLADALYVEEQYGDAIDAYTAAETVLKTSERLTSIVHFRILSHRAAAYGQLQRYQEAFEDARAANTDFDYLVGGTLRPHETETSWRRQGWAALQLGKLEDARHALEKAHQLATLNRRDSQSLYPPLLKQCGGGDADATSSASSAAAAAGAETIMNMMTGGGGGAAGAAQKPATSAAKPAAAVAPKPAAAAKKQPPAKKPASKPKPPPSNKPKPPSTPTTSRNKPITSPDHSGMPKYQYYQSDAFMTVCILEPNVQLDDLTVEFAEQFLSVILRKGGVRYTVIAGYLYETVQADACKIKLKEEKVLLKLKKQNSLEWPELLSPKKPETAAAATKSSGTTSETSPQPQSTTSDAAAAQTTTEDEAAQGKPAVAADTSAATTTTTTTTSSKRMASRRDCSLAERRLLPVSSCLGICFIAVKRLSTTRRILKTLRIPSKCMPRHCCLSVWTRLRKLPIREKLQLPKRMNRLAQMRATQSVSQTGNWDIWRCTSFLSRRMAFQDQMWSKN